MSASKQHGYEQSDARPKPLIVFAIGLSVLILLALLAASATNEYLSAKAHAGVTPDPMSALRDGPSAPLLQSHTTRELDETRALDTEHLKRSGWVDRENGITHVPIDVAMKHIVERGLPFRSTPPEDGR